MNELLNVTSTPHVRDKDTTSRIMFYVILALMPATAVGIHNFGLPALVLILVTVGTCVISEYVFNIVTHRKQTIGDLSAVVTGLLLALNLPSTFPWYLAVLGGVFAIVIVKMVFGGLGQNFMNPALGARCFLLISFTGYMTSFSYDGVATATPLAALRAGESVNTLSMLIGTTPGTIGETSVIAVLFGAIILILLGVINLTIPASYIISFSLFIILFSGHGIDVNYLTAQLCGGGLMLGAFFMATDYATSPITTKGRIIFGICCGLLTGVFRVFGGSAEGVSYAIIFSNLLVPLIEKISRPTAFGKGGKRNE